MALLLLVTFAAVPVDAQDGEATPEGTTFVADPTGDVQVSGVPAGAEPLPTDHVDLVGITFLPDDAENLYWEVAVAGRPDPETTLAEAPSTNRLGCTFHWTYNENSVYYFEARFRYGPGALSTGSDSSATTGSMTYRRQWDGGSYTWGYSSGQMSHDADTLVYQVTMPKRAVYVADEHRAPGAGDSMTDMTAACGASYGLLVEFGDEVDLTGIEHALSYGTEASSILAIDFLDPGLDPPPLPKTASQAGGQTSDDPRDYWEPSDTTFGRTTSSPVVGASGIEPGQPRLLEWRVTNLADSKKIARLDVTFTGAAGASEGPDAGTLPAGWNITLPEHIEIGAGASRTVRAFVTAPSDSSLHEATTLTLRGTALGHEDEPATRDRLLITVPPFGVDENVIHTHGQNVRPEGLIENSLYEALDIGSVLFSPAETLDGWDDTEISTPSVLGPGVYPTTMPLARGIALDNGSTLEFHVRFDSDDAEAAQIRIDVSGSGNTGHLLYRETEVPTNQDYVLKIPFTGDAPAIIPADTRFQIALSWADATLRGDPNTGVRLMLDATRLVWPLVPSDDLFALTDGRALPGIALVPGLDDAAYVNAGTPHAFDLLLGNDGTATDDLALSIDPAPPEGWKLSLEPGTRFRLDPGQAAPVSVLVTAPDDAAEGTSYQFILQATSGNDPAARARLPLSTIVTGLEVDENPYLAKEDAVTPLSDSEDASAIAVAPLIAGLLAAIAVGRRRRS